MQDKGLNISRRLYLQIVNFISQVQWNKTKLQININK